MVDFGESTLLILNGDSPEAFLIAFYAKDPDCRPAVMLPVDTASLPDVAPSVLPVT